MCKPFPVHSTLDTALHSTRFIIKAVITLSYAVIFTLSGTPSIYWL